MRNGTKDCEGENQQSADSETDQDHRSDSVTPDKKTSQCVAGDSDLKRKCHSDGDQKPSANFKDAKENSSFFKGITRTLMQFRRPGVFLPYLLNQSGSFIYYKLAATSDMTTAVPACNALAMVFSSLTSYLLGERLDKPARAFVGAVLVSVGVILCMITAEDVSSDTDTSHTRTHEDEL